MPSRVQLVPSLIIVAIVLVAAWGNSYQSCLRSEHIRESLRTTYAAAANRAGVRATVDHGLRRLLDLQAKQAALSSLASASHLTCAAPLPPT